MLFLAILLAIGGQQEPLTFGSAHALPPEELERRVFQATRGTTREVVVHDLAGNMYRANQRAEFEIDFADAPQRTRLPGLCSAQVRTAVFGHGYVPHAGERAPTHLIEVAEQTRYAVQVSKAEPTTFDARMPCATNVIDNPRYFEANGIWGRPAHPDDVIAAIGILQTLMENADAKRLAGVACTEDLFASLGGAWEPLCTDAAQSIAKLGWPELNRLDVQSCEGGRLCIRAYWQRPVAPRDASRKVELSVKADRTKAGSVESYEIKAPDAVAFLGITAID